ncbi:MAG TPA: gliding motility-associated protein GldE [Chitinophagaceae bacterium]|nr:gliding motility-associated protein GldE [Chitinophagaceae bacterium]
MDYHSAITFFTDNLLFTLLAVKADGTIILGALLIILMTLSFFIAAGEVALFSLHSKDINMLKTKQHSSARRIVDLLDEPKEVYTSLLIAGTFFNICIIVLSNFLINELLHLGDSLVKLGSFAYIAELLIKVFIIAFMLIFFCRILPKVWATQNNLRVAYDCSYVVEGIHLLLVRISRRMVSIADVIGKKLGATQSRTTSLQELDEAIDITTDEETSIEEKNILKGIVKFGNISVKQIMRTRLDVSGIEYNILFPDLLRRVEELHYSRLPVYKSSLDEVVGVLNTKDLQAHLQQQGNFDWHIILRQPFFVPETKLIEDLLQDFQAKRIHFAVVVDEFGGTSGIVTMEDILEEIIGEIKDEFDEEEGNIRKLDEHTFVFEGKTTVNDACKAMKIPQDTFDKIKGDSESMAGLVLELSGEFPATNTIVTTGDFEFTVMEAYKNRIMEIKVTIKNKTKE